MLRFTPHIPSSSSSSIISQRSFALLPKRPAYSRPLPPAAYPKPKFQDNFEIKKTNSGFLFGHKSIPVSRPTLQRQHDAIDAVAINKTTRSKIVPQKYTIFKLAKPAPKEKKSFKQARIAREAKLAGTGKFAAKDLINQTAH
eukprot:TRINITY_DN6928_c0_g1_i1.p2 TRINITY_DN6928_c0_g1~~TRINITY_DN6928_c0_g1_i1.p2  ORF type:complete len:142 (-),score=62.49 TRINITY_DN6928_c0_g1_i1:117-542(-)